MGVVCDHQTKASTNSDQACGWAHAADLTRAADRSALQIVQAIEAQPFTASEIVHARPWDAPGLLQLAMQRHQVAAIALRSSMRVAFLRSMGTGPVANHMFRATLRLEGENAALLQAEMRELVEEREDSGVEPTLDLRPKKVSIDDKQEVAERSRIDPAYGQLYGRFIDEPVAGANQLADEAANRPEEFDSHVGHLRGWIQSWPSAAIAFGRAVKGLQGRGAAQAQVAFAQQLHLAMARDLAGVNAVEKFTKSPDDLPQKVRLERLVPLLSEILSRPDVARLLVHRTVIGEQDQAPTLRIMLTAVLQAAYNDNVRASVRANITTGVSSMLSNAANSEGKERDQMSETAGVFLGIASNVEARVGFEESVAKRTAEMLMELSEFVPDDPEKVMKLVSLFMTAVAKGDPDMTWTTQAVNVLLHEVYRKTHPAPKGAQEDPEVREDQRQFHDWRRIPAAAFNREYKVNE